MEVDNVSKEVSTQFLAQTLVPSQKLKLFPWTKEFIQPNVLERITQTSIQVLAPSFIYFVTLSNLLNLFEPQFPHTQRGDNNTYRLAHQLQQSGSPTVFPLQTRPSTPLNKSSYCTQNSSPSALSADDSAFYSTTKGNLRGSSLNFLQTNLNCCVFGLSIALFSHHIQG